MNLTDVGHMTDDDAADGGGEDKMQKAQRRLLEAKKSGRLPAGVQLDPNDPRAVADYYIHAFLADARALGLRVAAEHHADPALTFMPRATDHVTKGMIPMIARLIERGHAYVASDRAVYFDVQSFPAYGRLSGNTLDHLRAGAGGRVSDEHQAVKRHPADFLLWKPDAAHLMKWDSPWGEGYPGWHIECSAMARARLGREEIDLHTGGEDNIFPHHECEIAQSCGCWGRDRFASFWLHTRFLLVDGEKMSKSKGNFHTVRDLLARGAQPAAIRLELLRSHYRSNANFSLQGLEDAYRRIERLRRLRDRLGPPGDADAARTHPAVLRFTQALADDLNIAAALAELETWITHATPGPSDAAALAAMDSVLGLLDLPAQPDADDAIATKPADGEDGVAARCAAIDAARARKDFAAADALRRELQELGFEVKTDKSGTTARRRVV
jgi:cysteinyl-tRNA synthetase